MTRWAVWRTALAALLFLCVQAVAAADAQPGAKLEPGSGRFDHGFQSAGALRTLPVWYHRPADAPSDAPIVFVLHGQSRNASTYRKYWIPFAEKQRFVLLVPEFSREQFPGNAGYNLGYMYTADGTLRPESEWTYSVIEELFDRVRAANGLTRTTYDIYGHSAGAQFVHRMVLFKPNARYRVAVAANSGWYTMPDASAKYPYGLGGVEPGSVQLARAFARRLIVLLGDADIDPEHRQLSRTPGANAQGPHRFARGHTFFEHARKAAAAQGVPLAWSLEVAPGVAHSNARMAPHAARFVAGGELSVAGSPSSDQSASTTPEAGGLRR